MTVPLYIVSVPTTTAGDVETIKKTVSEQNAAILLGTQFPTVLDFVDIKLLIGDPNHIFSHTVADMLAEVGVLTRTPAVNNYGRQLKHQEGDKEALVWEYAWGEEPFAACSVEQLYAVGWDLRIHPGFVHVLTVREKPMPNKVTQQEKDSDTDESFDTLEDEIVLSAFENP